MPAFPASPLPDTDVSAILSYLEGLCSTDPVAMPADRYLSNCASCHGTQAQGGHDSAGVHGPNVQCRSGGDLTDAIRNGADRMPTFPELAPADVSAIKAYVQGFCSGTIGGD